MNLYENILYIEPNEKISRAFYKLIEINYNFKLFTGDETLTGHLCELLVVSSKLHVNWLKTLNTYG